MSDLWVDEPPDFEAAARQWKARAQKLAPVALAAWYAVNGNPVQATDAWNDLCRVLEDEPESFPSLCRAVFGGTT